MRSTVLLLSLLAVACASSQPVPMPDAPRAPVYEVSGLQEPLFTAELEATQGLLAQWHAAHGLAVWPPEESRRAWALAAEGKSPLTGRACGMPLSDFAARRRWAGTLGLAGRTAAWASCEEDGGCTLEVTVYDLGGHGVGAPALAPYEPTADVTTGLSRALAALAPEAHDGGMGGLGVGGILGRSGAGQVVEAQREDLVRVSAWNASPARARGPRTERLEAVDLPGLTVERTRTCFGPREHLDVLFEVSPEGLVTRCEGRTETAPEGERCLCALLAQQAAQLPAKARAQRWSLSLSLDPKDLVTRDGRFIVTAHWSTHIVMEKPTPPARFPRFREKVAHASLKGWQPGPGRLVAGCFLDAAEPRLRSRWAVWFSAEGRPLKAVEQKGFAPLPPAQAECVRRALLLAQAPCPAQANLWAEAVLQVSAEELGKPRPDLADLLKAKAKPEADGGTP